MTSGLLTPGPPKRSQHAKVGTHLLAESVAVGIVKPLPCHRSTGGDQKRDNVVMVRAVALLMRSGQLSKP